MKRIKLFIISLMLILTLAACDTAVVEETSETAQSSETAVESEASDQETEDFPSIKEVQGVTIPEFEIEVNGNKITQNEMAEYPVVELSTYSVNSKGTETFRTFEGFRLADVLDAAGYTEDFIWLEAEASDGYTVSFEDDAATSEYNILALTENGEAFSGDGPWFAPGESTTTGDYMKDFVKLYVNTEKERPEVAAPVDEGEASESGDGPQPSEPVIADRTDKVEFADFSFKVNGQDITNADVEDLSIYKMDVVTTNKSGEASEHQYTGFALKDVLEAAGVTDYEKVIVVANDGYETELTKDQVDSEYTLLAIESDGEVGEDGTVWVAPGEETEAKNFPKLVVEVKAE